MNDGTELAQKLFAIHTEALGEKREWNNIHPALREAWIQTAQYVMAVHGSIEKPSNVGVVCDKDYPPQYNDRWYERELSKISPTEWKRLHQNEWPDHK